MNNKISTDNIKKLRNYTGAGIVLCKNALLETKGNFEQAILLLEKNGIFNANKKLSRVATEGIIYAYIHQNFKVGVLLELNCETDFVAKRSEFKELAKILAMQIASTSKIIFNSLDEIPLEFKQKEQELANNIINLHGQTEELNRLENRLSTYLLLKQPLILNENLLVEDYIKSYISLLGENIKISRFIKYCLNENNTPLPLNL